MKTIKFLLLSFAISSSSIAGEKKQTTADHLQNVSVTIRAEAAFSAGEGSGVIFTRKDAKGNLVNFVWTAAHVVDNLRSERKVLRDGRPLTIVEFKDPVIIKEIRQNGRTVGRLQMDAEVLKYSESEKGHDLALLRIRKFNFVTDSVIFYLDKEIPSLGTDLLHVGSLLGQMGANSMTDGIRKGFFYINGKKLADPYDFDPVMSENYTSTPQILPKQTYFFIGDNRSESLFGKFTLRNVIGKVIF